LLLKHRLTSILNQEVAYEILLLKHQLTSTLHQEVAYDILLRKHQLTSTLHQEVAYDILLLKHRLTLTLNQKVAYEILLLKNVICVCCSAFDCSIIELPDALIITVLPCCCRRCLCLSQRRQSVQEKNTKNYTGSENHSPH